jgi:hypothetical protein
MAFTATKQYEHGSNARFTLNGCRCTACTKAHRTYEAERRARIEPAYVSAITAREHCRELMAAGVGLKQIVKRSGVPQGTLWKLLYGKDGRPSKRVRKATQDRLLAVSPADRADGAKIGAAPTWVLIDEMLAAGVPKVRIAQHIGQRGPGLQLSRNLVSARNARAVAELHARWRAPPPIERRPPADISDLLLDLAEIVEERNAQPWRAQAACRNRPTYLWFPARGDAETADKATLICRSCLVRSECRQANLDQPVGIFAGLSAQARREIRRERPVAEPLRFSFEDLERYLFARYGDDGTAGSGTSDERQLSDTRIGVLIGHDRATVNRWRGTGLVPQPSAKRICTHLDVPYAAVWPVREEVAA